MQFAVVADGPEARFADHLVAALTAANVIAVSWTSQQFVQHRARVVGQVRLLFLGDGSVGRVMRKVAAPTWREHGARYAIKKRMGFLWVEDDVIDRTQAYREVGEQLAQLTADASVKRSLARDVGHPTGALVAHHYLQARRETPLLRLNGRAFDERLLRRQIEFGLAMLLLNAFDAWLEVALTPVIQAPRAAAPSRSSGPVTGFVSYEDSNIRNPTSSTAPPPPRRVVPPGGDQERSLRRDLADVETDLHRARLAARTRANTLAALPPGASDRRMRERELEVARNQVRSLGDRETILRRQLDALLNQQDRTPLP
ncbi:MAG: hypothetical protein ACI8PZ_006647 [Myxococcota bacterium]|jgi:hypothetical protein